MRRGASPAISTGCCAERRPEMALLSVRNVTKRYGGLVANNAVSFDVDEGALFAIIGPNGAGKTTLFNTISGAVAPTSGDIVFDGHSIVGLPQAAIAGRG